MCKQKMVYRIIWAAHIHLYFYTNTQTVCVDFDPGGNKGCCRARPIATASTSCRWASFGYLTSPLIFIHKHTRLSCFHVCVCLCRIKIKEEKRKKIKKKKLPLKSIPRVPNVAEKLSTGYTTSRTPNALQQN